MWTLYIIINSQKPDLLLQYIIFLNTLLEVVLHTPGVEQFMRMDKTWFTKLSNYDKKHTRRPYSYNWVHYYMSAFELTYEENLLYRLIMLIGGSCGNLII